MTSAFAINTDFFLLLGFSNLLSIFMSTLLFFSINFYGYMLVK